MSEKGKVVTPAAPGLINKEDIPAVLPILPRTGTFAIALPNDQVLLAGGTPAAGELELFTPEPPPP